MIYEILNDVNNASTKSERIDILRRNGRQSLKNVLQGAFHPKIKFVVKSPISYKKQEVPPGMGYTNIDTELKRIYLFVEGSKKVDPNLKLAKKINILTELLEAMEPKEAEIFMNMILKDLKLKNITYDLVKEAFPNILP